MPCPSCNGHNLWDDIMWWGCRTCNFMSNHDAQTDSIQPMSSTRATPHEWAATTTPLAGEVIEIDGNT